MEVISFQFNFCCLFCAGLSMHVKRGELVAIVGSVGTGKSSVLQALLGEMEKVEGTVTVKVGQSCCGHLLHAILSG